MLGSLCNDMGGYDGDNIIFGQKPLYISHYNTNYKLSV